MRMYVSFFFFFFPMHVYLAAGFRPSSMEGQEACPHYPLHVQYSIFCPFFVFSVLAHYLQEFVFLRVLGRVAGISDLTQQSAALHLLSLSSVCLCTLAGRFFAPPTKHLRCSCSRCLFIICPKQVAVHEKGPQQPFGVGETGQPEEASTPERWNFTALDADGTAAVVG